MKQIIILEGISTSGKTTLKEKLCDNFDRRKLKYCAIGEEATLMPILENADKEVALDLLNKIISDSLNQEADIIIFDRLYFTHIFRTNSAISDFASIENLLVAHDSLLILLAIEKTEIKNRILGAMEHRDKDWVDFVKRKGSNAEIIEYYSNQQDKLIELAKKSKVKSLILDTTKLNFDDLNIRIIEELDLS